MNNTQVLLDGVKIGDGTKVTGTRTKPRKPEFSKLLKADCRQIDGRSTLGLAMSAYKADLLSSLGGRENLSAQECTLVEVCSRDWFVLQQIDAYLLTAGLFSKRKKAAWPLLATRLQVADGLSKRLLALGLTKRARPVHNAFKSC